MIWRTVVERGVGFIVEIYVLRSGSSCGFEEQCSNFAMSKRYKTIVSSLRSCVGVPFLGDYSRL